MEIAGRYGAIVAMAALVGSWAGGCGGSSSRNASDAGDTGDSGGDGASGGTDPSGSSSNDSGGTSSNDNGGAGDSGGGPEASSDGGASGSGGADNNGSGGASGEGSGASSGNGGCGIELDQGSNVSTATTAGGAVGTGSSTTSTSSITGAATAGTVFVGVTSTVGTVTTTGYVDDCQPHQVNRAGSCYVNRLCGAEIEQADCSADGDTWSCNCSTNSGYWRVAMDPELACDACNNLLDWCAEGPTRSDEPRECESDYLNSGSDYCEAELDCFQPANLAGNNVVVVDYGSIYCNRLDTDAWECTCYVGDGEQSFQVEAEQSWEACGDNVARCGDTGLGGP